MATKTTVTPEEWELLMAGVMSSGVAVTAADPSGLWGLMKESFASAKSLVDAKANPEQKALLSKLSPDQVTSTELAGEPIQSILSHAPGNDQAIGGLKVMTENGWFAARPSGTEDIYKIYAESFVSDDHLKQLVAEAQTLVDGAISAK